MLFQWAVYLINFERNFTNAKNIYVYIKKTDLLLITQTWT